MPGGDCPPDRSPLHRLACSSLACACGGVPAAAPVPPHARPRRKGTSALSLTHVHWSEQPHRPSPKCAAVRASDRAAAPGRHERPPRKELGLGQGMRSCTVCNTKKRA
eukprot:scaffold160860_cov28-Tisochrysis_lutea.AAC.3